MSRLGVAGAPMLSRGMVHNHHVEDELCVCFHVSRDKIVRYVKRERPKVASLISQCMSAGTGCGWCIPFLTKIHEDVLAGREPERMMSRDEYLRRRAAYHERLASLRASGEDAENARKLARDEPETPPVA
jgi:bacterioferritin-associated ferredoxin